MLPKFFKRLKLYGTNASFFLFETVIVLSVFFSIIIAIIKVINFSNVCFRKNIEQFNLICKASNFYNENQNSVQQAGETIYFDGVSFYKFSVKTDEGTKYVFIKK